MVKKKIPQSLLISQVVRILPFISKKNIIRILSIYEKFATGQAKDVISVIKKTFSESKAGDLIVRSAKLINAKARKSIALTLIADGFIQREKKRNEIAKQCGLTPFTVLISPTMRCNLRCIGCYAGNYSQDDGLPFETVDRVVTEAKEMGSAFITVLGGEPFMWPGIFDLLEKHQDMYFQIYTNSTLANKENIKKIKKLGNAALIFSVEGLKEETDKRRGQGVFDKVMKAMDLAREAGIPFGYSVAVTKENEPVITSDEFVDLMISKGALIGWMFLYMPVGKGPDLDLMPTPEQRLHLLNFDRRVRQEKPLFVVDFWNDAPFVGGCIAGKHYIHITSEGWVEPCIFSHIAVDNIKEKSLKEVMMSDFFQEIRRRQPYNENLYLPCMWIDNPELSRDFHKKFNLHLTHAGADDILVKEDLKVGLDKYSQEVKKLYQAEWDKDQAMKSAGKGEKFSTKFGGKC